MASERMSELEGFSIKKSQKMKSKENKDGKNRTKYPRTLGQFAKGVTYMQWDNQNEEESKEQGGIWNSSD